MSFSVEKKTTLAHPFRAPGSTLISSDQSNLKIVYNKYKTRSPLPNSTNQLRYNFIFVMVLGLINQFGNIIFQKLYQLSQSLQVPWF